MSSIAIITARGGSKRIPRKNIRPFLGNPIIFYSIKAAQESGIFTEIMVSTDDDEIANFAISQGAKVPFLRSAKNSDDFATTADVIAEVLDAYKNISVSFDTFCCIYPTAPFVTGKKIRDAMSLLNSNNADTVVPVVKFGFPIQRALKIDSGVLKMIAPENLNKRSQDLPASYHDCGQFYCGKVSSFLSTRKLFTEKTIPLIFPETEVQDIDNETDWKIAELKFDLMRSPQK